MGKKSRQKAERRPVVRRRDEIVEALWDQYEFIEVSAALFDEGHESEAKRIATALRILTRDTRTSKSVLGQLDLLDRIKMLNTSVAVNARNQLSTSGLVAIQVQRGGLRYIPLLNDYPNSTEPVLLPYHRWLTDPIANAGGRTWSRQDLILHVADKDGGTHVDPTVPEPFHNLSRNNAMGWYANSAAARDPAPPENRYDLTAIRQIGHEMLMSIRRFHAEGTI